MMEANLGSGGLDNTCIRLCVMLPQTITTAATTTTESSAGTTDTATTGIASTTTTTGPTLPLATTVSRARKPSRICTCHVMRPPSIWWGGRRESNPHPRDHNPML